jgi:heptosyltransferase III
MTDARTRFRLGILRGLGALISRQPAAELPRDARILIIRPDHIGDVLLTTPAIDVLRHAFPDGYLAALVGPWSAEVIRRGPPVDALRTCEFPGFIRRSRGWIGAPYVQLRRARELRRKRFDVAVIARPDHWWGALLAALAGIPHRVGFKVPECAPFLTEAVDQPSGAHTAELSLLLARRVCELAGLGAPLRSLMPVFTISDEERLQARAAIDGCDTAGDGPLLVLHPGAGTTLKLWPAERWARTLDLVRERWDARTLIVSSSTDEPIVAAIRRFARGPHRWLTTDQGLGYLAAILAQADVVIGSDSGPLHLAAAVGARTVRLYGPTDPALFGPWPPSERHIALRALVPCSPCGFVSAPPCGDVVNPRCLLEQTPEDICESVGWVIGKAAPPMAAVG